MPDSGSAFPGSLEEARNELVRAQKRIAELESLAQENRRFRKIIEQGVNRYALSNARGEMTYSNAAIERILGYSEAEYAALARDERLHPDDLPRAEAQLQTLLSNPGATQTMEMRGLHKDGHYVWIETTSTNWLDDPDIAAIVTITRDITERKARQAEQAQQEQIIQATQAFMQNTLDAFPLITVVLDPAGTIVIVNTAWKRFVDENQNASAAYHIGEDYLDICDTVAGIVADDIPAVAAGIQAVITGDREQFYLEYPFTGAAETRWFGMRVAPLTGPVPRQVMIAHTNVTEQKLAEHELKSLYNATASLFRADSLRNLGEQVVEAVVQEFEHADCGVILVDKENNTIRRLARAGPYEIRPDTSLRLDGPGLVPLAIKTGEVVYAADVTQETNYVPSESRTRSELVIPLKTARGIVGVLDLQQETIDAFSERDQRLLKTYAERAAVAIEIMQLYEEINQHATVLEERVIQRTAELQATKERAEAILNYNVDAILLIHDDLLIQQTNQAFNNLFKVKPDAYFDQSLLNLIVDDDSINVEALLADRIAQHNIQPIEIRARRPDGTNFYAELSIGHIRDFGLVCTIRDITARKQVQDRLAEERNLLRTLIDTLPEHIYVKDTEHRFVLTNVALARSHGFDTPEAIIGKSDHDILPHELAEPYRAEETIIFETGHPLIDHEEPSMDYDGGFEWSLSTKMPLYNLQGELIGLVGINRDITERKKRERQMRFDASIQASMSDAVIVIDMKFNIQSWNAAAHNIYGWTADEVVGKPSRTILKTRYLGVEPEQVNQAMTTIGVWQGEVIQSHKDGHDLYMQASLNMLKDEQGTPIGTVGVIRDITAQKAVERQLRFDASVQASVSEAVIVVDMNHHIQSWNTAAQTIFGWSAAEVIGKNQAALLETRHPPGVNREQIQQQFYVLGTWQGEVIQSHKDGRELNILLSINLLKDEQGTPVGVVGVNRDITEQKIVESQLRFDASIQASVSDAVIVTDMDFNIQSWNAAAQTIYGWSAGEVIGKKSTAILQTSYESEAERQRTIQDFLAQGAWQGEALQRHKDGHAIHIQSSVNLFKDEHGAPVGVVAVNRDVTERKLAELKLQQYATEVEDLYNNAPCGYHSLDASGLIVQINDTELEWLGYSREEVVGRLRFSDIITAESQKVFQDNFAGFKERGWISDMEFDLVRKDGTTLTTLVNATAVKDPDGQYLRSRSTLFDISSLKHAEAALRAKIEAEHAFQERLKALHEITIELMPIDDVGLFYRRVVELGLNRLGFERLGLMLYDEAHKQALGTYGTNARGEVVAEHHLRFDPSAYTGILQRAMESGERFALDIEAQLFENFEPIGTGWNAIAALANDQQVIGWLAADNGIENQTLSLLHLDILALYGLTIATLLTRKKDQDALHESEERFRRLVEAAPVGVIISDESGIITLANEQANLLFDYDDDELEGQAIEILLPEALRSGHLQHRAEYIASPRVRQMGSGLELRAIRKDGSDFPVEIQLSAVKTRESLRVLSFIVDITERREAEKARREQHDFLQLIIDSVPDLIFVKDIDNGYALVNLPTANFAEKLMPESLEGVDEDFDPIQSGLEFFFENDQAIRAGGKPVFIPEQTILGRYYQVNKIPLRNADGDYHQLLIVASDITERKQAEKALHEQRDFLQRIIDSVPDLILVKDRKGRFKLVNDSTAKIYNMGTAELVGKIDADVNPNQHEVDFFRQMDEQALKGNEPLFIPEQLIMGRYYQTNKIPLRNEKGKFDQLLVVSSDITKRKEAEQLLQLALEKEQELSELKTRFVSMASHEFRTPLATILALTETILAYREKLSSEQIDQRLRKIQIQVEHLKNVMEDVLQLARFQARRVHFNPVRMDLDALCRSVLDEFQSRPDIEHQLIYSCDPALRDMVLDKRLMRQIINNLVSNAIKYSPPDQPITIKLEHRHTIFVMTVQDNGIGIPEDDLKHLFEPFHRAANVGTISGTGLGLVITKEAVELHGGEITVKSVVGAGTKFTITMPINNNEDIADDKSPGH